MSDIYDEKARQIAGWLMTGRPETRPETIRDIASELRSVGQERYEAGRQEGRAEASRLLAGIIEDGPYCTDDGDCSFCHFAPNDSEDLDHLIAHKADCKWRVAKEFLVRSIPSPEVTPKP